MLNMNPPPSSVSSADLPAQVHASAPGARPGAPDVLPVPGGPDVHAHAAAHPGGRGGPERAHGLLPDGGHVPAGLHGDGGRRLRRRRALRRHQQRVHSGEPRAFYNLIINRNARSRTSSK